MKEELKKFMCENERKYWYGCDADDMCFLIDKFFDEYQPERSKREDLENLGHDLTGIPTTDESWCRKCGEEDHVLKKTGMRCSEH